ncbi:PilC/PilY family type IV pilus protein [Luteimonas sp. A501]
MTARRKKLNVAAVLAVLGAGGYLAYSAFAVQAHPEKPLAQAPMNTEVQVPAAFIMAVDDSGSMTYQNQFPGADGRGCWSGPNNNSATGWSFFSDGALRTGLSGSRGSCSYYYSYIGPRSGNTYYGIPPVDNYGFARSPDFNPAYFDPRVQYQPWLNSDGTPYSSNTSNPAGNASTTATLIDPRDDDTVNLASNFLGEASSFRFQAYTHMVLPGGTQYRLVSNSDCGGLDSGGSGGNRWREVGSSGHTMSANCALYIRHYPATFYLEEKLPSALSDYAGITPSEAVGACGADCNLWKYRITSADTAALQNFANWFSYYGNRNRAMVAGMTRSLATINNLRVGYFTINGSYQNLAMRDMSDATDRLNLYESMMKLPASGNTPNLPAVNHMGAQFQRRDGNAPVQLACQRNGGMLFTDGFSNVASSAGGLAELGAPFDPTPANSMAAIASQYYFNEGSNAVGAGGVSPLNDTLAAGQVPVPAACSGPDSPERRKLNCQTNLHMNFYGVTLGARGERFDPDAPQDPHDAYAGWSSPKWPGYSSGARSTVDDIWHATVNTRGDFINARTPADIVTAMRRILASVSAGASPSGAIALTGARIGTGSLTVTPRYEVTTESDGTDWYGDIEAQQVSVNPVTREATFGPGGWSASARLPQPDDRRIYFAREGDVLPFAAGSLSLSDLCEKPAGLYSSMSLCAPAHPGGTTHIENMGFDIADAVDYLRGDETHEGVGAGHLRRRVSSKIGDIVNSTPVISAPSDDYGYRALGSHDSINYGSSYAEYLEDKEDRRYMVYVGANDGMLHAFDGGMDSEGGTIDSAGGRERFAYIPGTSLGHMGNLLIPNDPTNENDQKFQHRYYVDGPVVVSDAHYGGGWHTVLVGTTGAGGRGIYALNVDNPAGFDGSDRLWEISDLNTSLDEDVVDDIGFVLGKPVIVPVKTHDDDIRWVAVFGNGYQSKTGDAVLFVVDIDDAANPTIRTVRAIEAAGPNVPTGSNGLGNIVVVDRWGGSELTSPVRDGFADTVYAADQRGAIWKFDLRDEVPAEPELPVFVTQTIPEGGRAFRQPITGGMAVTTGAGGGVMLYFGTGSFSFEDDGRDETPQSLYAINDTVRGPVTETLRLNQLTRYTVGAGTDARGLAMDTVSPLFPQGWYVNLPAGERFVGYPNIATGMVFMPTYVPNAATTGCSTGGNNWLFGLNARTGAPGLSSVYGSPHNLPNPDVEPVYEAGTAAVTLATGGTAPVKDVGVFALPGLPPVTPAAPGAPVPDPTGRNCWMAVTVAGTDPMYLPYPCGRQSWRQVQ